MPPTTYHTVLASVAMSASTLVPCAAVEIDPALRLGGFVEAVGLVGVTDNNNRGGNAAFGPGDHVVPIFRANGELQIGGTVETDFSYQLDYEIASTSVGGTSTRLEQAFIRWQIDEQLALVGGRFEDWIGLERNDSPTWYRTRLSPLAQLWHGIAETGANLIWRPAAEWKYNLYVVNGIWSETGIGATPGSASKKAEEIGAGASAAWRRKDLGTVTIGGAFDAGTHLAQAPGVNGTRDTWGVFATAHYEGLKHDSGFFCFADLEYIDYDDFAGYGAMIGAVQAVSEKASVGLAVTYIDPNTADDAGEPYQNVYNTLTTGTDPSTGAIGGTYGKDDELIEYCLSLTTTPRGTKNVLFNAEFAVQDHVQKRADVLWFDLQLIIVIP